MKNQTGAIPFIIIGVAFVLLISAAGIYLSQNFKSGTTQTNSKAASSTSPTSTEQKPLTLATINFNIPQETDVMKIPKLKGHVTLADGSIQYSAASFYPDHDDIYIYKDAKLQFARKITINANLTHPSIDDYIKELGQPNRILTGSKYYGDFAQIYVFAQKGVAVIANSNTKEVYEQQQFQPMTIDEYLQKWANDYQANTKTSIDESYVKF